MSGTRSSADGGSLDESGGAGGGAFYALDVKLWTLQVGERQPDGVWRTIHASSYFRKADAMAAAERQGMAVDYVSHHADYVRGQVIGVTP